MEPLGGMAKETVIDYMLQFACKPEVDEVIGIQEYNGFRLHSLTHINMFASIKNIIECACPRHVKTDETNKSNIYVSFFEEEKTMKKVTYL